MTEIDNKTINEKVSADGTFLTAVGRAFSTLRKNSNNSLMTLSWKAQLPLVLIDKFEGGAIDIEVDTLAELLDHIGSSFAELFNQYEHEMQQLDKT